MRYTRYIAAFVALIVATACTVDDVDRTISGSCGDKVTVIGRMTRFEDKEVATRGVKNEAEATLTSMALAIFPVNGDGSGLAGNCVYYQYSANQQELLFTIERGTNYTYNTPYVMYVFVNMPGMEDFGQGSTLEDMMAAYYDVTNLNIPENGFPMMGSLGDTFSTTFDRDDQRFILSPTDADNHLIAPTTAQRKEDGTWDEAKTQNLLTIPMKAMFAKVNFQIKVTPDQQIEGNYSPQFAMEGYTINNVPSTVDFTNATNSDTAVLDGGYNLPVSGNMVASAANTINFSFYLPERLLTPATSAEEYKYPFGTNGAEVAGYSKIREEDKKYAQRYKGKLLGDTQKATNIVISGTFRDHQNHYWDVDYTIYLGEDNYSNFNIVRNSEYNNYVTIRGIQSSNDMSDNATGIAIDHRVNVERTQPAIISLRRETLLDSHFEVRPLRIRKSEVGNVGDINAVKVEVVNPETTDWMRLERSFGDGTLETANNRKNSNGESFYITDSNSPSYGKRRYFTNDLIDGTVATNYPLTGSTSVVVPISEADECVWIYVDECTEVGDDVRAGIIRVTYGNLAGSTFTATTDSAFPVVNYAINQRKLFKVTNGTRTYYIEYEEEYLHNFDADDNYGSTEYEGMEWGLDGIQLSYADNADGDGHFSVVVNSGDNFFSDVIDGFMNYFINSLNSYYDFYIKKHDSTVMTTESNLHEYAGHDFCSEIINITNGYGYNIPDAAKKDPIDVLNLTEQPSSAIEYCYNKNKRTANGQVVFQNQDGTFDVDNYNWYLPAVDEIEDIVTSDYLDPDNLTKKTYARFKDFQDQYYWSSQPSYNKNLLHYNVSLMFRISADYDYYTDDVWRARATRVVYDTTYHEESSSVEGYYMVKHLYSTNDIRSYNLEELLKTQTSVSYSYSTSFGGSQTRTFDKSDLITRKPASKLRTSKARVRCVRVAPPTTTTE
ncbi:MAG: DUF4906 domain-containing protein [Alistipes sp.]|nr:DUF4906 domain-containing protein [Alistipes sp.]